MIRKPVTKTLNKEKFELDETYSGWNGKPDKKHLPEIEIIPYVSFGIGTKINVEKNPTDPIIELYELEGQRINPGMARVTRIFQKKEKVIIEAEIDTKKAKKMEFVNKIVKKINFKDGLKNNIFIKMFANVFSQKQLERFIKAKDLEMVLFDGLMYLKHKNKAYRL